MSQGTAMLGERPAEELKGHLGGAGRGFEQAGDETVIFENEDWTVTGSGLEHRRNGYFIGRDEVAHKRSDGLWTWPVHLSEKLWCRPSAFAQAFTEALRAYGVAPDAGLALSFLDAGRQEGERAGFAQAMQAAERRAARRESETALRQAAATSPRPLPAAPARPRGLARPAWRPSAARPMPLRDATWSLIGWLWGATNRK